VTETFTAQIRNWSDKTKRNLRLIFQQSIQDVFFDAQLPVSKGGRMRVLTGFLRGSLTCYLNGSSSLAGPDSYILKVTDFDLGDVFFGGWTADYAVHREFGARGQTPDMFMRGAAMKWNSIVQSNAKRVDSLT
jgi:hypothetical protein